MQKNRETLLLLSAGIRDAPVDASMLPESFCTFDVAFLEVLRLIESVQQRLRKPLPAKPGSCDLLGSRKTKKTRSWAFSFREAFPEFCMSFENSTDFY